MATIYDIIEARQLAAFWQGTGVADPGAYVSQELFPAAKQIGLNIKWIKGAKGQPVVLKASAFDAHAVPHPRIGLQIVQNEMPYFKESSYVDEEPRQQLSQMMTTANQGLIDNILTRIFNDEMRLLVGAARRREQMRMMALTTGQIDFASNGQQFTFDYMIPNKVSAITAWEDWEADILEDIRIARDTIQQQTGEVLTRAICDGKSWANLRKNEQIRSSIFAFNIATGGVLSDTALQQYLKSELGLDVFQNNYRYYDDTGTQQRYMPENTFVMFPSGTLGQTWFGTTPAENDLMTGSSANVAIVDTGVSITTSKIVDPVQVQTIVAQICLPSLEKADSVYILDTAGA
jgi:hypothetical protein